MTNTDLRIHTGWKYVDNVEEPEPAEVKPKKRSIQFGMDGMPMGPWNNHIKCSCGEPVR